MGNNINTADDLVHLHHLRSPQVLVNLIVDLLQTFDSDFNPVFEKVREELIRREYEAEKKKTAVSANLQIARYHVRKYFKEDKKSDIKKITKDQFILFIRQELNSFSRKKGRKWLYPHEFKRITDDVSFGELSNKVCFNALHNLGLIEKREDGNYFLCDYDPKKYKKNIDMLESSVPIINRLLSTMKSNLSGNYEDLLFQRDYYSTKIPPDKAIVVDYLMRQLQEEYHKNMIEMIDSNESENAKAGDYEPVGYGLYQFNLNKK